MIDFVWITLLVTFHLSLKESARFSEQKMGEDIEKWESKPHLKGWVELRGFGQRYRLGDDASPKSQNPEEVVLCPSHTAPLRNAITCPEISIPESFGNVLLFPWHLQGNPVATVTQFQRDSFGSLCRHKLIGRKKLLKHRAAGKHSAICLEVIQIFPCCPEHPGTWR